MTSIDLIRSYFKPGAVVHTLGYKGCYWDKVIELSINPNPAWAASFELPWVVTVVACNALGNPVEGEPIRNHCTRPNEKDFTAVWLRIKSKVCTCGNFGPFGNCDTCRKGPRYTS